MVGFRKLFLPGLAVLLASLTEGEGRERVYYVGIREADWDYAPSGQNLINGKNVTEDEHAFVFLQRGPQRIGSVYKKAMFRQYTDASYSREALRPAWLGFLGPILHAFVFLQRGPQRIGSVYKKAMFRQYTDASYSREALRPAWLGFLGPILWAEVEDVIVVHLKNFASRNYSMHPHGVFYEKDSEGALYPDRTSGRLKKDDAVPPGGSYTYRWEVTPEFAPTEGDANCLSWVYHSHVEASRDISSGLIGPLLTCKKGVLKQSPRAGLEPEPERLDVDQDVFLLFTVMDESLSWYHEENIQTFCSDPNGVDPDDPDFHESNLMHAINGYLYGNLPGMELCQSRPVAWHLFGMGNEVDIHSAYFQGNTLLNQGHRTDTLSVFPATFVTAEMVPIATGKWLLSCQVNDHLMAGMQALYEVKSCGSEDKPSAAPPGGQVRHYYIAAVEVLWDYGPSGRDTLNNKSLTESESPSEVFFGRTGGRIGGRYRKAVYEAYTDDTFTTRKPLTPESLHLGILGPVLRAEVGDTLRVTFQNKADRNYSIQPHGLYFDKRFQGTSYQDGVENPGSQVRPGETFVYDWQVMEGPSSSDPPCIPYLYFSANDPTKDTNAGLVGPLLVCRRGTLGETGTLRDADKELFLLFSVMDENESWYLETNTQLFGSNESNPEDEYFQESNKMHAVNGFMYGNLPGLEMCSGDRVVWYNFGLGTEVDIHGIYFQGNTFQRQGTTRDTLSLFPHVTATMTMEPHTPDVYEISCRVTDHYMGGMREQYTVKACPGGNATHTRTHHTQVSAVVQYYISAEEVEWDYSPDRAWELEKHHATLEDSPGTVFLAKGENRIGSRYKKVVYREYTDDTFGTQKERQPEQEHLGILGPIIRAEVGEQIHITLKNKAGRPYSIQAHGVETSDTHTSVQPGDMTVFRWDIPERSGPGVSDPNCISYAYYSTVNFVKDMFSGLLGTLVVCRRGTLRTLQAGAREGHRVGGDRRRGDVQREFALLFLVFDENQSWYLDDNIRTYLNADPDNVTMDEGFEESNKMHGINGKLYGNLHGLTMAHGQKVDWYLLGMGNEVDMHTVHFHAETFTYMTDRVHRADVFDLFPGIFQTVEMVAGNPGTWLLHCHVTDHIHAGMETMFTITAAGSSGSVGGCGATLLLALTLWLLEAAPN